MKSIIIGEKNVEREENIEENIKNEKNIPSTQNNEKENIAKQENVNSEVSKNKTHIIKKIIIICILTLIITFLFTII